jgi:hypothetical protein
MYFKFFIVKNAFGNVSKGVSNKSIDIKSRNTKMAKIVEDIVIIKFSRIVKDSESGIEIVNSDIQSALEQVAQELVGNTVVVEVEKP